jgi:hypothetical protein
MEGSSNERRFFSVVEAESSDDSRSHSSLIFVAQNASIDKQLQRGRREMRAIRYAMVAAKLTFGLVTVAQAHPFIGVGITGGPVFPVASSAQSAPPLPVYARATDSGPAPLPPDAPPVRYAEPAIGNISAIMGRGNFPGVQSGV